MVKKTLDELIEAYKNDSRFHRPVTHRFYDGKKWVEEGDTKWHWDDNWDLKIIVSAMKLEEQGFKVYDINRKGTFKMTDPYKMSRYFQCQRICTALDDNFFSISFAKNWGIIVRKQAQKTYR